MKSKQNTTIITTAAIAGILLLTTSSTAFAAESEDMMAALFERLNKVIDGFEQKVQDLQDKLNDKQEKIAKQKKQINKLEKKIDQMRNDTDSNAAYNQVMKENKQLKAELEQAKTIKENKKQIIANITSSPQAVLLEMIKQEPRTLEPHHGFDIHISNVTNHRGNYDTNCHAVFEVYSNICYHYIKYGEPQTWLIKYLAGEHTEDQERALVENYAMLPDRTIWQGESVYWTAIQALNVDITITSEDESSSTYALSGDAQLQYQFDTPGKYTWHMPDHPHLHGIITVVATYN